eukprot:gnl/MRDRNA2_/MRDRNA2_56604_c0_seq1.p1 gnl/MRDRNA2_/MRDRNA2_56604_c0~~gnl/MRDRNA2_/MRDRNA2_56604_c0_seq1.p1  ORF type:complete len:1993 (-),score=321.99 gnl/MRDRNA2_/MRDRNA2_56604_c0_seq1:67-6045(-)
MPNRVTKIESEKGDGPGSQGGRKSKAARKTVKQGRATQGKGEFSRVRTIDAKRTSLLHHWAQEVFRLFSRETVDGGFAIPVREVPSALQASGCDSKNHRAEIRHAVEAADLNSSGDISLLEFETVQRAQSANDPNYLKMMEDAENDQIEPRFLRVVKERQWDCEQVQALSAVFGAFDPDGDDVLTYEEAKTALWWVTRENKEIFDEGDEGDPAAALSSDHMASLMGRRRDGLHAGGLLPGLNPDADTHLLIANNLQNMKQQVPGMKSVTIAQEDDESESNEEYELALELLDQSLQDNGDEVDFLDFFFIMADLPVASKCNAQFVRTAIEQEWSREDIRDLHAIFCLFDLDGTGAIDHFELMSCFQTLGISVSKQECLDMIKETDKDKSGCIDFHEFLLLASEGHLDEFRPTRDPTGARRKPLIIEVVSQMGWEAHQLKDFKKIFESFDIDGDGTVTVTEMLACFQQISTEDEGMNAEILEELDKDGSDDVDFVEFLMFLSDSMGKSNGKGASSIRRKSLLEAAAQHASSSGDDGAVLQQFAISIECLVAEVGVQIKKLPITFQQSYVGRKSIGRPTVTADRPDTRMTMRRTNVTGGTPSRGGTLGRPSLFAREEENPPSCAERLVNCIQRVLQATRQNSLQEKLQQFILEFCTEKEIGRIHRATKPWKYAMDRWLRFCYNRKDLMAHEPPRWGAVKKALDNEEGLPDGDGGTIDTEKDSTKLFDPKSAFPPDRHDLQVLAYRKQMRFAFQHCQLTQHLNVGSLVETSMALRCKVLQEEHGKDSNSDDFKLLPQELKPPALLSSPASRTQESLKKNIHDPLTWKTGNFASTEGTATVVAKDSAAWRADASRSGSAGSGPRRKDYSSRVASQRSSSNPVNKKNPDTSSKIFEGLGALQCAVNYSPLSAAAAWKHQRKSTELSKEERRGLCHNFSDTTLEKVPLHLDRRFGLSACKENSSIAEEIIEFAAFEKEQQKVASRKLNALKRKTYIRDIHRPSSGNISEKLQQQLRALQKTSADLEDDDPDEQQNTSPQLPTSSIEIKPCFSEHEDFLLQDEVSWQEHFQVSPRSKDVTLTDWRRKAADYIFMRNCWHQQILPKGGPQIKDAPEQTLQLDLHGRMCSDSEALSALQALESIAKESSSDVKLHGPNMHSINMSGNRLSGATLNEVFSSLELRNLTSLDLSHNVGMFTDAGELGVSRLSGVMRRGDLSNLTLLSLDGVRHSHWIELGSALTACSSLTTLSLADTGLGSSSQVECVVIAEALQSFPKLVKLDVSSNYLRLQGCQAFGEAIRKHQGLQELLVAGNAGGFAASSCDNPSSFLKKSALEGGGESKGSYPPLLILCEALAHNDSITLVDLTSCQLRYSAAFVLEGSLLAHPRIQTLVVQDNPFGPEGLECILRLVTQSKSLEFCDVTELRQGQVMGGRESFYARNPGANYKLDLSHPYDRAVLLRLLVWCWQHDTHPNDQIESLSWDGPKIANFRKSEPTSLVTPISQGEKSDNGHLMPRYQIPTEGHVHLTFLAALPLESPVDGRVVVARDERLRRVKVTLKRFVTLAVLWNMLSTTAEQQLMLITAIRNTVLLKKSQLKHFARHTFPELLPRLVKDIIPCLPNLELSSVLDLVPKKNQQRMVLKEIQKWIYFNPSNPTGRYILDLTRTTDYTMAEHCLLINSWHRFIAEKTLELPDLSQHGDGENLRNCAMNKTSFQFKSHGFQLPRFPCETTFRFDYVSPLRPDIRDLCIPEEFLEHLCQVLETPGARIYDKAMVLGSHGHKLALEPQQLRELLEIFPGTTHELGTFDSLQAAVEELDTPRVEVFVLLFTCVADRALLCSPEVLYNPELFQPAAVRRLWDRLGRLRTFDLRNVCQYVTSNLGNVFDLSLFKYEDHMIAQIVLRLGCREDGENLIRCWYSEVNYLSAKALDGTVVEFDFLIPATWLKDMPRVGQLRFTYQSEKVEFIDMDARDGLGEKSLGWSNIDRDLLEGTLRTNAMARVRS